MNLALYKQNNGWVIKVDTDKVFSTKSKTSIKDTDIVDLAVKLASFEGINVAVNWTDVRSK